MMQKIAEMQTFYSGVETAIDPRSGGRRTSRPKVFAGDRFEEALLFKDIDDVLTAEKRMWIVVW